MRGFLAGRVMRHSPISGVVQGLRYIDAVKASSLKLLILNGGCSLISSGDYCLFPSSN